MKLLQLAAILAGLVAFAIVPSAAQAATWSEPVRVGSAKGSYNDIVASHPRVSSGADGTSAITWVEIDDAATDAQPFRRSINLMLAVVAPDGTRSSSVAAVTGYTTGEHITATDASGEVTGIPMVTSDGRVYLAYNTLDGSCGGTDCHYRLHVAEFDRNGATLRDVLISDLGRIFSDGHGAPIMASQDGGVDVVWAGSNLAGDFSDQQPVVVSHVSGSSATTVATDRTVGNRPAGLWIAAMQLAPAGTGTIAASWATGGWSNGTPTEYHLVHADSGSVTPDLFGVPALSGASAPSLVPNGTFLAWFPQSGSLYLRRATTDGPAGLALREGNTSGENPVTAGADGHACGFVSPTIFPAVGGHTEVDLPVQDGDPSVRVVGSVATKAGGCLFAYPNPPSHVERVAYAGPDGTVESTLRWAAPDSSYSVSQWQGAIAEGREGQFASVWAVYKDGGFGVWFSQLNDRAKQGDDGTPTQPNTETEPPASPAPSAGPCAKVNGTLLDKLSASLKCSTVQLVNQTKCGVGVVQWVVLPLKSLQFATTARGYLDLRKISDKRLHSLARFYNRYWKGQHARTNLPNGFQSPAQLIGKIEKAQDIYGLIRILTEMSDGSSVEEIQQMALDLTDIAGVKACVEGLALGME